MSLLSLIPLPARVLLVLAILGGIAAGVLHVKHTWTAEGRAEVQADWDADKAATAEVTRLIIADNTRKTTILQSTADQERGVLHARLHSSALELDESLRRLRARPDRPAEGAGGVPANPGSGDGPRGCTAAELYADDAEALVRFAAKADRLQLKLDSCQRQYRAAQATINGIK